MERLENFAQNLDKDDYVMLVARNREWHVTIFEKLLQKYGKMLFGHT